jgi:hypothetical protein
MDRKALLWKASLAVVGELAVMHRVSDTKRSLLKKSPLSR